MKIFVPGPSGIGILGGWPADGEVDNIEARKKGTSGEGKEGKTTAGEDLSSGPQRDTAIQTGEIQLFEMTTNLNNEREQNIARGANDPASAPSE